MRQKFPKQVEAKRDSVKRKLTNLQFMSIINTEDFEALKHYESTEVDLIEDKS